MQHAGAVWVKSLTAAAEALAEESGAKMLYLLTTSAEHFFSSVGCLTIPRDTAPPAVQQTPQFKSLCPSTAILMVKP
jgi:amino-acid N-acetyltransferase